MKLMESMIRVSPLLNRFYLFISLYEYILFTMDGGEAYVCGVVSVRGSSEQKLLSKH